MFLTARLCPPDPDATCCTLSRLSSRPTAQQTRLHRRRKPGVSLRSLQLNIFRHLTRERTLMYHQSVSLCRIHPTAAVHAAVPGVPAPLLRTLARPRPDRPGRALLERAADVPGGEEPRGRPRAHAPERVHGETVRQDRLSRQSSAAGACVPCLSPVLSSGGRVLTVCSSPSRLSTVGLAAGAGAVHQRGDPRLL